MTMTPRQELLLKMYDQMFADIDRHVLVTWQSATALVGGLAVFALAEKGVLPVDFGASIVMLLVGWLLAHLIDASYWYNRNLVIIANIERQFLVDSDIQQIHYYFGAHRPKNRMITHLQIQFALGIGLGVVILVYHFLGRVWEGMRMGGGTFEVQRALPYAVALGIVGFVWWLANRRREGYAEFVKNSPGLVVQTGDTSYGVGHGYKKGEAKV